MTRLLDSASISTECSGRWPSLSFQKQQNVPVRISGCGVVAVQPINGKIQCENLQANHSVPLPLAFLFIMMKPESNGCKLHPDSLTRRREQEKKKYRKRLQFQQLPKRGRLFFF